MPGIGSITGDLCKSHASATWAGVAPRRRPVRRSGPQVPASIPPASGAHGMKGIPNCSHSASTASEPLSPALNRFCTEAICVTASALELRDAHVADPDVLDLPLLSQLDEPSDRLLDRNRGVDRVQLIQGHTLDAQAPQAALAGRAQVLGPAVTRPEARATPCKASLGRHHDAFVRVQRLCHEPLAHLRAVRVGRIEEVDLQLTCALQQSARTLRIARLPPSPMARQLHRPQAETPDRQIPTEDDRLGDGQRACAAA